jgi:hypothetical protein
VTDDAKDARREQIAALTEGRLRYRTYWLTRNRFNGVLSEKVDIWLSAPHRIPFQDGDVHWVGLSEVPDGAEETGGTTTHFGRWTLEQARHEVGGGVPATDIECLRVGPEIEKVKA